MSISSPTNELHNAEPENQSGGSWLVRFWHWLPDWLFRLMGAGFFFGYLFCIALPKYIQVIQTGDWKDVPFYRAASGRITHLPFASILIDMAFLLIAFAFCFRSKPVQRPSRLREIVIPMIASFWPMLPVLVLFAVRIVDEHPSNLAAWLRSALWFIEQGDGKRLAIFTWKTQLSIAELAAGVALTSIGHAIDVWGYATLFRSLSIVPEARSLKTRGPFRLIRHPIYFGQLVAQAGVWLVFACTHWFWIAFYLLFVAMQLYRARLEERVLERFFGDSYRAYKKRTFWI